MRVGLRCFPFSQSSVNSLNPVCQKGIHDLGGDLLSLRAHMEVSGRLHGSHTKETLRPGGARPSQLEHVGLGGCGGIDGAGLAE